MSTFLKKMGPSLAVLGLAIAGCQPDLDAPAAGTSGTADFTSYVAIGNSLTAGYSDGGLYNEAQATSYPSILAKQFARTGKGPSTFVQPAFADNQQDGSGHIKLQLVNGAAAPVQPTAANQYLGEKLAVTGQSLVGGQLQLAAYTGAQPDNLGIPGISVLSSVSALTNGLAPYGLINPFYERLLTSTAEKATKDYVTYIAQKTPTFFTCWMGSNDVLTYATNGGVISATNPFSNLTDTTRFGIGYRAILNTASKAGTVKGVVANIPNVANVPYFTTVAVPAVIASIKANTQLPNAAQASLYITTGTGTVREATTGDLLLLTSSSVIGTTSSASPLPLGVGYSATLANPLPSQYVLDATELAAVQARTKELNTIIARTATKYKLGLADMNTFFNGIATNPVYIDATTNTTTFATGNLFSLDGVHPTPRGYAVIANEFIRVINQTYGASVPSVNPNDYRAVLFP